MPVLMVVLGRRCGYPFHLVACGGHLFARWDDGTEKFNFDITNSRGIKTEPDDYYIKWPRPISKKEITEESLMQNLTNKEMLGIFASLRAVCFQEHKRYDEAIQCYAVARQAFPSSRKYPKCIEYLETKMKSKE